RTDFTSLPVSWMPTSSDSTTWYSCRARRLTIRGPPPSVSALLFLSVEPLAIEGEAYAKRSSASARGGCSEGEGGGGAAVPPALLLDDTEGGEDATDDIIGRDLPAQAGQSIQRRPHRTSHQFRRGQHGLIRVRLHELAGDVELLQRSEERR